MTASGPGAAFDVYLALLDEARSEQGARARRERAERRRRRVEAATWQGALCDAAERGARIQVGLVDDRHHVGRLRAVARDHLVLIVEGRLRLVAADAVAWVRPEGRAGPATGERDAPDEVRLLEALDLLWRSGDRLGLRVRGRSSPIVGRLLGVGEDVVSIADDAGGTHHVPAAALVEAWPPSSQSSSRAPSA